MIVLETKALQRLADLSAEIGAKVGITEEQIAKARLAYDTGALAVAVIESPVISEKIPAIEQTYSAGAVCLALLNAALAAGWGANWLSGWFSHNAEFCQRGLDMAPHERLAGFIHIGTERIAPSDRPRPDLTTKTTWMSE